MLTILQEESNLFASEEGINFVALEEREKSSAVCLTVEQRIPRARVNDSERQLTRIVYLGSGLVRMPEAIKKSLPKLAHCKRCKQLAIPKEDCEGLHASFPRVEVHGSQCFRKGAAAIF